MTIQPSFAASSGHSLSSLGLARVAPLAASLFCALGLMTGCTETSDDEQMGSAAQALESENGLSTNGLSTNGLSTNGFSAWFNSNPASYSATVMKYVVLCAVPEGQSRSFVSSTGQSYTWTGLFGLAPSWASGNPIPVVEQQLVSACLAAHANAFGLHVDISVRGKKADGSFIPVLKDEKKEYKLQESCFFGNLFDDDDGVFAAPQAGHLPLDEEDHVQSSPRMCGVVEPYSSADCAPFLPRLSGTCASYCTGWSSSTGTYNSCSFNGKTYKPLTTYLDESDLFECGDGVCQITEIPYSQSTHKGCGDCGVVP